MTSSVDPRTEITNIKARLNALPGTLVEGAPQGFEFPVDGFGKKQPYRDFEAGSVIPSATQRLLAGSEQDQPHVWAFQIHHYGSSREEVTQLAIESDLALIGWVPSPYAGPISTFYFTMYDEFAKNGEFVGWIATRFYETTLGQSPDFGIPSAPGGGGGYGLGGYGE